jgi:hypothetical protein
MVTVKKLFSLVFICLLIAPAVLWLSVDMSGYRDNTVRQGFPLPEPDVWFDRDYYQAVEGWFRESLPVGRPLRTFNNWLNYHLFAATSTPAVHIGIHGWLYPGKPHPSPAQRQAGRQMAQRLFLDLHAAEKIITASGRHFVFSVVPDKAAIYPEYLGIGHHRAPRSIYRALLAAHRHHPLTALVPLTPTLKKAKLSGSAVYGKQSVWWTCGGAAAAADQILKAASLTAPTTGTVVGDCPPTDNFLYRQLLGDNPPAAATLAGHTSGPHAVTGPSAVVYGDAFLNQLLPHLTHAFTGMQIIDSMREPSFGPQITESDGDWILLAGGEASLERLHLDLEALYAAVDQPMKGVVSRRIDLSDATVVGGCALNNTAEGLQIRSTGPDAFFSLPIPSISTNSVFRMVKLTFATGHQGPITVKPSSDASAVIRKPLSRDNRYLIIPLPFSGSTALEINPSEHPGVFILEEAEMLSFYGDTPPPAPMVAEPPADDGDIYSGMVLAPSEPPAPVVAVEAPDHSPPHPTDALPELTLSDIQEGRIFQRRGRDADIVVTGTYTGVSGPVEARVVEAGTGAVVLPWTVVDGSPENGLFAGILAHVPQGGWYRLQVRSGLAPWVVVEGSHRWGVGMLVTCIGQSNMREWFYTGQDHLPSADLRRYRDGTWIQPGTTGNGALAMGNRLAATLKIPVGLLDYSVNGTGLTAKAEWGKGFWLDTGPESIYRRWIDGINAVGGAVEYVLWMQGEADAARGTISREEYRRALERFVSKQVRADIENGSGRDQLPFLIIPLVKRPSGRDLPCQWIRDAQMDALQTIDECHLAGLSIDLENRGRQHLAPDAYTALGVRTAQTILYLLDKMPYHRGPAIAAVTRSSAKTVDVAIAHRGGTDFTPWTDISGFEVVSGDRSLAIAGVYRKDAVTIRIALENEADDQVFVRYLYGAHPNTTRAVRDNTDLRLPLEPYHP